MTDLNEFDEFSLNHEYGNIMQSSYWAKIKSGDWRPHFLGLYDGDKLAGVALLLERSFMLGYSFFYCSKGPVLDYKSEDDYREMISGLQDYVIKNKGFILEFDPEVVYKVYYCKDKTEIMSNANIFEYMKKYAEHKGFSTRIEDTNQPRYQAVVDLSVDDLRMEIPKKRRAVFSDTYLGKRGFEVNDMSTKEGIKVFSELIKRTEERQGIYLRNEDYFMHMYDVLNEDKLIKLFITKVDMDKLIAFATESNRKPEEIEKLKKLREEEGQFIYTNALLCVLGTKMVQMYYGASDERFNKYNPGSRTHLEAMQWAKDHGYRWFNLGGISGTYDDHLYNFKSVFSPIIFEYVGDFKIVCNKVIYQCFIMGREVLNKFRKLTRH